MNQRNVDALANLIRVSDGTHSLGAGELAERLASRGVLVPSVVTALDALTIDPSLESPPPDDTGGNRLTDMLFHRENVVLKMERIAKGESA